MPDHAVHLGFAAVLIVVGVVAAILRKEGQQIRPALSTELVALNSSPVAELSRSLNATNYQVLESFRDAASLSDLMARLDAIHGNGKGRSQAILLNQMNLLRDLDVIRVALERPPLGHE